MGHSAAERPVWACIRGCGLGLAAAGLLLWPGEAAQAVREGLRLCGTVLIPALFPFLVLSSLVVELGLSRALGRLFAPVMGPLFRVNGACGTALALGLVGGCPVGAKTALQLYESGQCSRTEAQRLLAFCNNCGPAFILGVVGTGIFHSNRAGLLLYAVHLLSALTVGVLFRFYRRQEGPSRGGTDRSKENPSFSAAFTGSVAGALNSCLTISAFVLTFAVLLRILRLSGLMDLTARLLSPLGIDRVWAGRLLTGLLELSSGVAALTDGDPVLRLAAASFLLGWSGLSVHCQVLALLGNSGLSLRPYFIGKILQSTISPCFFLLFVHIFQLEGDISCLSQGLSALPLDFYGTFSCFSAGLCVFWTVMMIFSSFIAKYAIEKRRRL